MTEFIKAHSLNDALLSVGMGIPKAMNEHGFTRYGKGGIHWVKQAPGEEVYFFGNWQTGESFAYRDGDDGREHTAEERREFDRRLKEAKAHEAEERQKAYAKAKAEAESLCGNSEMADANHPYLKKKRIQPHGLLLDGSDLLVPITGPKGLQSVQRIKPNGDKRFLTGGEIRGGYFKIPGDESVVVVCEGFATGAAINESTGYTVYCALSAGNLARVSEHVVASEQGMVVIAADDDVGDHNTGVEVSAKVANDVSAVVAYPRVNGAANKVKTDFSDLFLEHGASAVKKAFDLAIGGFFTNVTNVTTPLPGKAECAHIVFDQTVTNVTNVTTPLPENTVRVDTLDEGDDEILAAVMPQIDERAFYGPLAHMVEAATKHSEATKVGVAMQVLANVSLFMRPFAVGIGDEMAGCNVFLIQVGLSGLGRKGTSNKLGDEHLAPAIRHKIAQYAKAFDDSQIRSAELEQGIATLEAEILSLRSKKELAGSVTERNVSELVEANKALEQEKEVAKGKATAYAQKLNQPLSPATSKQYAKAISAAQESISDIDSQIRANNASIEYYRKAIDYPAEIVAEIDSQIHGLLEQMNRLIREESGIKLPEPWQELFCSLADEPNVMSGVTSGEGIVDKIRDDRTVFVGGCEEVEPGNPEKRLFLNITEFGGVLTKMRQPGSSLSEKFRQGYDCSPLETGSKHSPCKCKEPYVVLSGSVTPAELCGLLFDAKDTAAQADNGVGNRPVYLYAVRNKLVSRPMPTEGVDEMAEAVFRNLLRVYSELKPVDKHLACPIEFTDDGAAAWDELYRDLDGMTGVDANSKKLFGRVTTNARKLAAILAVLNGQSRIDRDVIQAVFYWMEFSSKTINAVASTLKSRAEHRIVLNNAEKILHHLSNMGGKTDFVGYRDLPRYAHLKKKDAVEAINYLQSLAPSPIEVMESEERLGANGGGRRKTLIRLTKHFRGN